MRRTILSILTWIYWTICFHVCLVITAILFLFTFPFDKHRKIPNQALRLLAWLILKPIPSWHFEMRGVDKAKVQKPTIIVANHQSFLDIPLLYLLPWSMKWVTKRSMLRIPVLGWLIAMTGHIPIDRESLGSVRAMDALVQPIEKGIPGMIFPEGTRTPDGDLRPFKRGAFVIAKKYNFQVLPVVLEGGYRAMPSGSWKFRFGNTFIVSILDPVDVSEFSDVNQLKAYTHNQIQQELDGIRAEHQG